MEEIMKEIMSLCVRYHEMYMMGMSVRSCGVNDDYETLVKAYQKDKKTFDEQYIKIENLINTMTNINKN